MIEASTEIDRLAGNSEDKATRKKTQSHVILGPEAAFGLTAGCTDPFNFQGAFGEHSEREVFNMKQIVASRALFFKELYALRALSSKWEGT